MADHEGVGWKVRAEVELEPAVDPGEIDVPVSRWQGFGVAVLSFHHRVGATAMCRCGRTVIECDVLAQTREHGLLPELKSPRQLPAVPRVGRRL